MRFCVAGHTGSGSSNLTLRLSRLYPMHHFEALTYPLAEGEIRNLSSFDGILLTVSLLDGPMPGTRAAIADAVSRKRPLCGFCFTHLDVFDQSSGIQPYFKELEEIELRELTSSYGIHDKTIPACWIALVPGCEEELKAFFEAVLQFMGECGQGHP